jgi:formylglycine-generating enzyme required for sulfatase activity
MRLRRVYRRKSGCVLRGGSWHDYDERLRNAYYVIQFPAPIELDKGLRLLRPRGRHEA